MKKLTSKHLYLTMTMMTLMPCLANASLLNLVPNSCNYQNWEGISISCCQSYDSSDFCDKANYILLVGETVVINDQFRAECLPPDSTLFGEKMEPEVNCPAESLVTSSSQPLPVKGKRLR